MENQDPNKFLGEDSSFNALHDNLRCDEEIKIPGKASRVIKKLPQ
jgi:hypothetical protein